MPSRARCRARRTSPSRSPRSPRRSRSWRAISASSCSSAIRAASTSTHKGHQFLRHATKILADVSDARRSFHGDRRRPADGCSSASPRSLRLRALRICWPATGALSGVEVSAIEDNGDYLEHLLVGGKLDIAVMVTSNLRDPDPALQSEILEVSAYRLWLPLSPQARQRRDHRRQRHRVRAADHADRRRDRGEHPADCWRAIGARPRMSPSAPVRSRPCAVSSQPGPASHCCRTWSTKRGVAGRRPHRICRDISGSLPVVQVGTVWRRGSGLPQAARDFIGLAQSQRTVRQRRRLSIGKTDIGFLINEFAKPDFSQHLSLREQAVRERGCRGNQRR